MASQLVTCASPAWPWWSDQGGSGDHPSASGEVAEGRRDMAWTRSDDDAGTTLASMAAPLLRDLLCFCSMAASHPLHLAYLLFFSPYLLAALSFLGPLLISTCLLLLALLTVSPYLIRESPPLPPTDGAGRAPAGPFGDTLRLVVGMLDPSAGGESTELIPPPEALCDIASALQACVDSVEEIYRQRGEAAEEAGGGFTGEEEEEEEAEEEEKRIVAVAAPSGAELFGWELEAISKLYRALTYEVEEFPVKLALRSFKEEEDELFPPVIGLIQGDDRKLQSGEPGEDLPRKETPCSAEFQGREVPAPEEVDIPVWNPSKPAIRSRCRGELRDRNLAGEISSPPKRPTPRSKGSISRSESDGSRSGTLLRLRRSSSSSSTSRAAAAAAAAAGLSRVASARGWSAAGTKGAQPQALSSSGSTKKEKEWRRTLACKLFEERMVADGVEEGMDLLWETYDQGSGEGEGEGSSKVSRGSHDKERSRKKGSIKAKRSGELHVEAEAAAAADDDDDEEEEEEETTGRLCCLQALRFSPSKMGLGMGRSGLLRKVSKAMKGVGVFRRAAPRSAGKLGKNGRRAVEGTTSAITATTTYCGG